MKKFEYVIYQVKASVSFSFMNWEYAKKHAGWSFDPYYSVWNGTETAADDMDLIIYLWEVFNERHPKGFKGHSMTVSDIVLVKDIEANEKKYYYCDSFGWKDITREVIKWWQI